jgi:hypothetical protein
MPHLIISHFEISAHNSESDQEVDDRVLTHENFNGTNVLDAVLSSGEWMTTVP